MDDVYEQERQAREMDKAHLDRERNWEYCPKCHIWKSRYITHECKGEVEHGQSQI